MHTTLVRITIWQFNTQLSMCIIWELTDFLVSMSLVPSVAHLMRSPLSHRLIQVIRPKAGPSILTWLLYHTPNRIYVRGGGKTRGREAGLGHGRYIEYMRPELKLVYPFCFMVLVTFTEVLSRPNN